jgi:mannose-6-phosphate isomerase-like protein (cupin superfamily)
MKPLIVGLTLLTLAVLASAQSGGKAEIFSAQEIRNHLSSLAESASASGSSGVTLADYGSHKVQISVRTASGGAEIHAHYDDVMIVEQGTATLVTGGSVIDPKTTGDGETKGTSIEGGTRRAIAVGDVITVNAGVPHQLLIPQGTIYSALVIKVKE